jgi:D-alanine-D-alanine ligase
LLGIVFGGPSPEHDISILTGLLCERVLRDAGQDVLPLYWTRAGDWVQCPPRSEAKDYLEGAPGALSSKMQPPPSPPPPPPRSR